MRSGPRLAYLALGSIGSTLVGFGLGLPWLLPLLGAAVPLPIFLRLVWSGSYSQAARWVLVWAVLHSVVLGAAVTLAPERASMVVSHGPAYAREMLHWIETGDGPEGSPRLFLPIHIRHYAAFCLFSVLTGGVAALALGAWLLNFMNYYVAELVRGSADPLLALGLGWPLWAILRVMGYVATGTSLAAFGSRFLAHRRGSPLPAPFPVRLFVLGLVLVVMDVVLKAALAPSWRGLLLRAGPGTGG